MTVPDLNLAAPEESYPQVIEAGIHELFEPRSAICPMCGAMDLVREQTLRDLIQLKPGYFHMSRCRSCGHIFQNPRLNAHGLDFYYRDFYTGAGEATIHRHLASMTSIYRARARMIEGRHRPRRWLDVGAGYGHFCRIARETWQETEFHVLDVSPSIQDAQRQGWARRAYVGAMLELVPQIEETYDVISMFHYLEHTVDPRAELQAAATVVEPEGWLMIEIPDPDSIGRRVFGRYWPSWFAPQHLHLIRSSNMETYLREAGFEAVLWHRAEAHQSTDCAFAMEAFLRQSVPNPGLPWILHRLYPGWMKRLTMNLLGRPVLFVMKILDALLSPLRYVPGWPNTYRVLARRKPIA